MTFLTNRNRANENASPGPRSDDGKARSSQNSLKNGLYSKSAILPDEDREEYLAYGVSFVLDLRPEGPVQSELVQVISDSMWRLRRVRALESNQTHRVSQIVIGNANSSLQMQEVNTLESIGRHEQRLQNGMLKASNN
jgi:hypothetical protein